MKCGVFFAAATATPALGVRLQRRRPLPLPKEGDKARFGVIQATVAASRQTAIRPSSPKMKTKI